MQLCLFRWLLLSGHATGCNADPSAVIERRLTALVGHLLADLGDLGAHLEHDLADHPGQVVAQAEVRPGTEGQVLGPLVAVQPERAGIGVPKW